MAEIAKSQPETPSGFEKSQPKPCGCGGEAKVETVTTRFEQTPRFRIRCEKCNISTIWDYFSEAEAVEAWNTAMGANHFRDLTKMVDATDTNVGDKERMEKVQIKGANVPERTAKVVSKSIYTDAIHNGHCGNCGSHLISTYDVYCHGCGAKLIWNNAEDGTNAE